MKPTPQPIKDKQKDYNNFGYVEALQFICTTFSLNPSRR